MIQTRNHCPILLAVAVVLGAALGSYSPAFAQNYRVPVKNQVLQSDIDFSGFSPINFTGASRLPVATNASGVLATPATFWTANSAAIASAVSLGTYQPLDADLTALAALTTTAYGRGTLTATNAAALRTYAALGTAATLASTAFDPAGSASSAQAFAIQRGNHAGTQPVATVTGAVPDTRTIAGKALSANVSLVKADVGLGSVDNTSDAAKPISTATQTALDTKQSVISFAAAPASPTAAGVRGTLIQNGNYLYICIATNTWRRADLLTW